MTAPFDDAALKRARDAVHAEMKKKNRSGDDFAEVFARAALTAALAPEPTPLEAAAFTLFELNFEHSPSDGDDAPRLAWTRLTTAERVGWASDAKDVIDAYVKAGGAAKRRITRAEALEIATIFQREHGGATDSMVAALAAVGIEVSDG